MARKLIATSRLNLKKICFFVLKATRNTLKYGTELEVLHLYFLVTLLN